MTSLLNDLFFTIFYSNYLYNVSNEISPTFYDDFYVLIKFIQNLDNFANLLLLIHYMSIMCLVFLFMIKDINIYSLITVIVGFIMLNFTYFFYENMQNGWIYFIEIAYFYLALIFNKNEYHNGNKIEKFLGLFIKEPGVVIILLVFTFLVIQCLKQFLVVSDIIIMVKPCWNMAVFLDWACIYIFISFIVIIASTFWGYYNNKNFVLEEYINCKYLLIGLLSIPLGFIFNICAIQPFMSILYIQSIKIEQFIHLLDSNIRNKIHLILRVNEFLIDCIKTYNFRILVRNYIRNNWIFHIWKFDNKYTYKYKYKTFKYTSINVGQWATSMPKPILLNNKYIYFKEGYRYIRPTIFFEYVKKFSNENSYFTSLNISNFTKVIFTINNCVVPNNHCNSLVKYVVSPSLNNYQGLIKFIASTKSIEYLGNNKFISNFLSIPIIQFEAEWLEDLRIEKYIRLNINKSFNKFIGRSPNTGDNYNVKQAIKNIVSLNYNINIDLKNMFNLHNGDGSGIPITDFLCNILSIYEGKLRIGYLVASRLASITYDLSNQSLDCFIMEKFKQDYGHIFAIDYLYVYYPYIPYFDCCIVEGGRIIGHNLDPSLHTNNALNFMFHSGQLDNIDHMHENNVLLGLSYFDNFITSNLMPLQENIELNKMFFEGFFDIYNLCDASKGMDFQYKHDNNNAISNLKFFLIGKHPLRNIVRNYIFIDINYSHLPNQSYSWFGKNIINWGRDLFAEKFLDNCYSIFTDGNKIIFVEYKNTEVFSFFNNDSIHEKILAPPLYWRNYTNCNFLNIDINNQNHQEMLNMLNLSVVFTDGFSEFYKSSKSTSKEIMSILRTTDYTNVRHFIVAQLNDRNSSYYIDHTMRYIFNTPSTLGEKIRQPYSCKYIFKPNFGSKLPDNWN